jgi:hypothetical protein
MKNVARKTGATEKVIAIVENVNVIKVTLEKNALVMWRIAQEKPITGNFVAVMGCVTLVLRL